MEGLCSIVYFEYGRTKSRATSFLGDNLNQLFKTIQSVAVLNSVLYLLIRLMKNWEFTFRADTGWMVLEEAI